MKLDEAYQTKLMDLTSTANTIYVGYAEVGVGTSVVGWTIQRTQFDVSGNPLTSRWTLKGAAIWDNRLTETYL